MIKAGKLFEQPRWCRRISEASEVTLSSVHIECTLESPSELLQCRVPGTSLSHETWKVVQELAFSEFLLFSV